MARRVVRGTTVIPPSDIRRVYIPSGGRQPGSLTATDDKNEHTTDRSIRKDDKIIQKLGRGIAYPFEFSLPDKGVTGLTETWGKQKIHDSMFIILSTRPGERLFRPSFGSRLPLLVFESYDEILEERLKFETKGAIERWEPRVQITAVDLFTDGLWRENGRIGINIQYVIRNSNIRSNYVYPYQLQGEPYGA